MAQVSPDRSVMRTRTEYISSPQQQVAAKLGSLLQTNHQVMAKMYFRQAEAQSLADLFRHQIEEYHDVEFREWTVTDIQGDLLRKAFIKVKTSDGAFVHLMLLRGSRYDPWMCRAALEKGSLDPLELSEDDYDSLPDRRCGEKLDFTGCRAIETCKVM